MKRFKKISQFLCLFQTLLWLCSVFRVDAQLSEFVREYHLAWVLVFVFFLASAIFELVIDFLFWIRDVGAEKIYHRKLLSVLRSLKPTDKFVLSKFINGNTKEVFLVREEPSVEWLSSQKILITTGSVVEKKEGYRLAIWVRDCLIRNPNLLA